MVDLIRQVSSVNDAGETVEEEYNTVLFAIGRDACTSTIGIEKAGVMLNPKYYSSIQSLTYDGCLKKKMTCPFFLQER